MILAKIDPQVVSKLFFKYNTEKLVEIFKNRYSADCMDCAYFTYTPGLLDRHLIIERYSTSLLPTQSVKESYVEHLEECEYLSSPIMKIMDTQNNITKQDSCDNIDIIDRYKGRIDTFEVFTSDNVSHVISVQILYDKTIRRNGSTEEIIIGVVTSAPADLIGAAYLRIADIPNFNEFACTTDPGVTKLIGTTERIFSNLNVENLLSVLDLESIIVKIRSNRIVDCLGYVNIQYSPGLMSTQSPIQSYKTLNNEKNLNKSTHPGNQTKEI
ncbi:unnamed protein product [Oppiella nova]|uniref:Uncharacterized protein n=1 Tax=Oppiella nova TaxID=334625 RepID=A0A7R9QYD7_9ACAR|nr:unnamed protein product [Oppiella nova]CAG2178887.1 unnamed protein product [Oppiella nova]